MLNKVVLNNIFRKLLEEAKNSYDDFNSADGKIGDGDLGVTILHGLEEINTNISKLLMTWAQTLCFVLKLLLKNLGLVLVL